MKTALERLYNGIIKENPTLVLLLGMCPTLAVTTSAINGLGMGLSSAVVLILSNLIISALRKVIPNGVRMPAYIVVVASLVTLLQMLIQAYIPSLYSALGIYIPLIVVNCIILGRAEAYAGKNKVIPSIFDGIGMGIGFTLSLTIIGIVREVLGSGSFFGMQFIPEDYHISIIVLAPGAFFVLAMLVALRNKLMSPEKKKKAAETACEMGCEGCNLCSENCDDEIKRAAAEAKVERAEKAEKVEKAEKAEKAEGEKQAVPASEGEVAGK